MCFFCILSSVPEQKMVSSVVQSLATGFHIRTPKNTKTITIHLSCCLSCPTSWKHCSCISASNLNFRFWVNQRLNRNIGFLSDLQLSQHHSPIDPLMNKSSGFWQFGCYCTAFIIATNSWKEWGDQNEARPLLPSLGTDCYFLKALDTQLPV